MKVAGKNVVVTGGASGIGRALCERFRAEGAKLVVVADIDGDGARLVASDIQGVAWQCDVSQEDRVLSLIDEVESRHGPIDLYCSNAGIAAGFDPAADNVAFASNEVWMRSWAINVMPHVYAARTLVPRMKERGGGYFLLTASAAGLLSMIGSAVYSTTKHAAIGFAELLAIAHRDDGIRVAVLCPQWVDTPLLRSLAGGPQSGDAVIGPNEVAAAVVQGLDRESFLILPHPEVQVYFNNKASNYDRWIGGMAKLQRAMRAVNKRPL